MTKSRKPAAAGRGRARKLKLKKETVKDLDVRREAKKVRGGLWNQGGIVTKDCGSDPCPMPTDNCTLTCLYTCFC